MILLPFRGGEGDIRGGSGFSVRIIVSISRALCVSMCLCVVDVFHLNHDAYSSRMK